MDTDILRHVEILIGSIGVILGIFFSVFLISSRHRQPKANIFLAIYLIAFSLRVGKSIFHNYFEIDASIRTLFLTTLLCVGPSIWLYTIHTISSDRKSTIYNSIHFIPFFVFASLSWIIPNNGSSIFGWFYDFLTLHMFCYTIFSLFALKTHIATSQKIMTSAIRDWLYRYHIINLLMIIIYFLISEMIIPFYIGISFLFSSVIIYLSFSALRNPILFTPLPIKYKQSSISSNEAADIILKVKDYMLKEKPYLNPTLKLSELSIKTGVSTKVLSQAINQIESINYSQFVSKYRVQEVQDRMKNTSYDHISIAAIAHDSGFNSISTFNSAFKKQIGTTAIAYRNSMKEKK